MSCLYTLYVTFGYFSLMSGDFAAVAVLISFGAVLGILSPMQLTVMAIIEVVVYVINRYIGVLLFQVICYLLINID